MHSEPKTSGWAIMGGFLILFVFYHLPEFFQRIYSSPLIWLLETGMGIFIIVAYFVIQQQKGSGLKPYGIFNLKKYGSNGFTGLLFGFGFFALNTFLSVLLGWNSINIDVSPARLIFPFLLFALGTLLPSLAEDILTRGYVFAHWPAPAGLKWMIPFSAGLFVLNHIFKLNRPDILLYLFILGLWLAWCLVYTGSLWLTLGIHWGSNLAYQCFSHLVIIKTLKETGLENYMLALSYALGFLVMWLGRRWLTVDRPPSTVNRQPL
jgi:uncharacterized protein